MTVCSKSCPSEYKYRGPPCNCYPYSFSHAFPRSSQITDIVYSFPSHKPSCAAPWPSSASSRVPRTSRCRTQSSASTPAAASPPDSPGRSAWKVFPSPTSIKHTFSSRVKPETAIGVSSCSWLCFSRQLSHMSKSGHLWQCQRVPEVISRMQRLQLWPYLGISGLKQ